jgi:hypothetical protein
MRKDGKGGRGGGTRAHSIHFAFQLKQIVAEATQTTEFTPS